MLLDGRDICTTVLPNATAKIYLTATAEERARRRWLEMQEKGMPDTFEEVLQAVKDRDNQDMNRKVEPLRQAEDAVLVDSTNMTFDEVVETILAIVEEKRRG
jgi:cytidylate kinase